MPTEKEAQELGQYWRFQSGQMWSRLQTASFIEAGVLTAWYSLYQIKSFTLGLLVLAVGAILLIIVGLLMRRDSQYMQACERKIGPSFPKPDKPFLNISGRLIAISLPVGLAILDVVLIFVQQII
jgi:hypothetical protein